MQLLITLVCFVISGCMLFSMFFLLKRSKKMKKLIHCVEVMHEENEFFERINQYITTIQDPEFITKGQVLKLWGLIRHQKEAGITECLAQIDLRSLIIDSRRRKKNKINLNEDSFYYLCFACNFKAYSHQDDELIRQLHNKIEEVSDYFQDQLFYLVYQATYANYVHQEDEGKESFLATIEGQTKKYRSSKSMLDIYKNISATFLAKIAYEKQDEELMKQVEDCVVNWTESEMGKNIVTDLGVLPYIKKKQVNAELSQESQSLNNSNQE